MRRTKGLLIVLFELRDELKAHQVRSGTPKDLNAFKSACLIRRFL